MPRVRGGGGRRRESISADGVRRKWSVYGKQRAKLSAEPA